MLATLLSLNREDDVVAFMFPKIMSRVTSWTATSLFLDAALNLGMYPPAVALETLQSSTITSASGLI